MAKFQKMSHSVTVRMTPQHQLIIARAALAVQESNGDFLRRAGLERAEEILLPRPEDMQVKNASGDDESTLDDAEFNRRLGKAVWIYNFDLDLSIPCCSECGNGPLIGNSIAIGLCGEHEDLNEAAS